MRCPFCRHPSTSVVDSRAPKPGFVIRRRRQCPACGKRFTTFERVAIAMPWIIKRGGGRVEYNRAKLRGSMQLALRKRPVSSERIDAAVGAIEHKLSAMGERSAFFKIGRTCARSPARHGYDRVDPFCVCLPQHQ